MATAITELWMDGFVKEAEAAGYKPDEIPGLLKLAGMLQAKKDNPKAFNEGYETTMKTAGLYDPPSPQTQDMGIPNTPVKWYHKLPFLRSYFDKIYRDRMADTTLGLARRDAAKGQVASMNQSFTPGAGYRRARGNPFITDSVS